MSVQRRRDSLKSSLFVAGVCIVASGVVLNAQVKDRETRLGKGGWEEIMNHSWLKDIHHGTLLGSRYVQGLIICIYINVFFLLGDLNDKNMIPFEPPPEGAHA